MRESFLSVCQFLSVRKNRTQYTRLPRTCQTESGRVGRLSLHPVAAAGQAEPAPDCCRRIEHEFGKHRLDFPNSPVFRCFPENICRHCLLGSVGPSCRRRAHGSVGHRLEPPDSSRPQKRGCSTGATAGRHLGRNFRRGHEKAPRNDFTALGREEFIQPVPRARPLFPFRAPFWRAQAGQPPGTVRCAGRYRRRAPARCG